MGNGRVGRPKNVITGNVRKLHEEALRLLNIEGIVGRNIAKRTGYVHQYISDMRRGREPMTTEAAHRVLAAFNSFSTEATPRIKTETEP